MSKLNIVNMSVIPKQFWHYEFNGAIYFVIGGPLSNIGVDLRQIQTKFACHHTLKLANCSTLTRIDRIRCSLIDFAILTTMMQSVSWNKIVWIASRLLDFDIYETECAVYFLPSSDNWLMRRISFNQIWHSELNVQSISWSEDILIDFNNDRGFSTSICVSLHLISIDSDI